MSNQNPLASAIDVYSQYVSNLHSTLNSIVQLQSRIEQNLHSIVENEIYNNLRMQLSNTNTTNNTANQNNDNNNNRNTGSNRYSTRNFNEGVHVSIPSPPGSPPFQQPILRSHIPIPRFVSNPVNNNPVMNRRQYVAGRPYRTYYTNNSPTFTFNPFNEIRHGSGRRPTRRQINVATESLVFSNVETTQTTCPISLRPFEDDDRIMRIIHCGHIFTEENLRRWFQSNFHCPLCRYDIRQYSPRRAIRNPYNQSVVRNSDSSNNPINRERSNSADGELETSPTNNIDSSNNVFENLLNEIQDSSGGAFETEFTFDISNGDLFSNIINHLSSEVAGYLSNNMDLSNISLSEGTDISLNFLTAVRTIPITRTEPNTTNDTSNNISNDTSNETSNEMSNVFDASNNSIINYIT